MPDILIIPQRGTSNNPTMHFTGSALANIRMEVLPSGSISFIGTSGSLFNVTDNLIGSLMSVGDVSGLPILEVFSDDRVVMGKYGKNTVYVSGTNVGIGKVPLNAVLDVSGSAAISGSAVVTGSLTANGKVIFNNGGTGAGANSTLGVIGDITTYRASNVGVIYLGSDGGHYLFFDGSNYYMPSGQLYVNGTQAVLNSGTWGISVTGNATAENFATVTSRGASTSTQITVATAAGGSMVIGNKVGGTYGDGVSGATFKSILDNANGGGAFAFASYYGGSGGTLGASIRADGYSYFSSNVGIGSGKDTPNAMLDINGNLIVSGSVTATAASIRGGITFVDGTASGGIIFRDYANSANRFSIFFANNAVNLSAAVGPGGITNGFRFGTTSNGNSMILNDSGDLLLSVGNLGVSKSNPNAKLDVNGNAIISGSITTTNNITANAAFNDVTIKSVTSTAGAWVTVDSASDGYMGLKMMSAGNGKWILGALNGNGDFVISRSSDGATNRWFTLNGSGNVGIGTTSPNTKLEVNGNGNIYRDLYVNGGTGGSFANRIIIGNTSTPQTLQDGNLRPTFYMYGNYPVLTFDHLVTSNTAHGPTIQFTFNGLTTGGTTGRQIVIGAPGDGGYLDFGFAGGAVSSNTDLNPHRGISGFGGTTAMRLFSNGLLVGNTGAYPSQITSTSYALDVRGNGYVSGDLTVGGNLNATVSPDFTPVFMLMGG